MLLLPAGNASKGVLEARGVTGGEELLGVGGTFVPGPAHLLRHRQVQVQDAVRGFDRTVASPMGRRGCGVQRFHVSSSLLSPCGSCGFAIIPYPPPTLRCVRYGGTFPYCTPPVGLLMGTRALRWHRTKCFDPRNRFLSRRAGPDR